MNFFLSYWNKLSPAEQDYFVDLCVFAWRTSFSDDVKNRCRKIPDLMERIQQKDPSIS